MSIGDAKDLHGHGLWPDIERPGGQGKAAQHEEGSG